MGTPDLVVPAHLASCGILPSDELHVERLTCACWHVDGALFRAPAEWVFLISRPIPSIVHVGEVCNLEATRASAAEAGSAVNCKHQAPAARWACWHT